MKSVTAFGVILVCIFSLSDQNNSKYGYFLRSVSNYSYFGFTKELKDDCKKEFGYLTIIEQYDLLNSIIEQYYRTICFETRICWNTLFQIGKEKFKIILIFYLFQQKA